MRALALGLTPLAAVWLAAASAHAQAPEPTPEQAASCMRWSAPELVMELNPDQVDRSQIAVGVDASGRAIMLYGQRSGPGGVDETLYVRYRPAGGVWSAPEVLWQTTTTTRWPGNSTVALAVAPDGSALATWRRDLGWDAGGRVAGLAAYTPEGGWQTPIVPGDIASSNDLPALAMSPSGLGMAAWVAGGNAYTVRAISWTRATGWGREELVPAREGTMLGPPALAINSQGQVLLVNQPRYHLWASLRSPDGVWGKPTKLTVDGGLRMDGLEKPVAALNDAGEALVAWSTDVVHSRHYDPASGQWQAATRHTDASVRAAEPRLALNASGQAVLGWRLTGMQVAQSRAQMQTYTPQTGWLPVTSLSDFGASADKTDVALDAKGQATAVWAMRAAASTPYRMQTHAQTADGQLLGDGATHRTAKVNGYGWQMATSQGEGMRQRAVLAFSRPVHEKASNPSVLATQVGRMAPCPQ